MPVELYLHVLSGAFLSWNKRVCQALSLGAWKRPIFFWIFYEPFYWPFLCAASVFVCKNNAAVFLERRSVLSAIAFLSR